VVAAPVVAVVVVAVIVAHTQYLLVPLTSPSTLLENFVLVALALTLLKLESKINEEKLNSPSIITHTEILLL